MKGLDMSFARPPAAWFQARRAEGWEVMIQCAWTGVSTPSGCQQNLANARQAGFITGAYTNANNLPGVTCVEQAKAACGPEWEHLAVVPVDVEIAGIPVPVLETNISHALEHLRALGKRTCIYTANWFWTAHMGNTTRFRSERLWNAYYDGDPDYDFWRAPYGGWTMDSLMGTQYQGTTNLAGHDVDLDEFEATFFSEEADMLYVIKKQGSTTAYITDWVQRWGVPSPAVLEEMRAKAKVAPGITTVSAALFTHLRPTMTKDAVKDAARQAVNAVMLGSNYSKWRAHFNNVGGKIRQWCAEGTAPQTAELKGLLEEFGQAGNAPVDVDALAEAVADKLAERMAD